MIEPKKIMFLYRVYGSEKTNPVIDFQLKSLSNLNVSIDKYLIERGGILGYLKGVFDLRHQFSRNNILLIHAHYSFSGYFAVLSFCKPVICSLMGSDVLTQRKMGLFLVRFFSKYLWSLTIVKSKEMQKLICGSVYLPNGVDINNFKEISKIDALSYCQFSPDTINIIFVAKSPESYVKNIKLAHSALSLINDSRIRLHVLTNVTYEGLPYYYNAANLLILTSLSEGSPNVIKEAMACNCPIVATDVGDIREIFGNTEGCYLTKFEPDDVASKIKMAIMYGKRTIGRKRIIELGLDSKSVSMRLGNIYKQVLTKNTKLN